MSSRNRAITGVPAPSASDAPLVGGARFSGPVGPELEEYDEATRLQGIADEASTPALMNISASPAQSIRHSQRVCRRITSTRRRRGSDDATICSTRYAYWQDTIASGIYWLREAVRATPRCGCHFVSAPRSGRGQVAEATRERELARRLSGRTSATAHGSRWCPGVGTGQGDVELRRTRSRGDWPDEQHDSAEWRSST